MPFERILVAIDGSEASDRAFAKALELAGLTEARLTALAIEGPLPAYAATVGEVEEVTDAVLTNLAHGPFNWIIIDTPPVLAVTDAVVVAPLVSGVVFVVGAEMTRRRLAERALETVLSTRPRQVAILLNKVDFERNKYYYSRYYGHQYKNYYAQAV